MKNKKVSPLIAPVKRPEKIDPRLRKATGILRELLDSFRLPQTAAK